MINKKIFVITGTFSLILIILVCILLNRSTKYDKTTCFNMPETAFPALMDSVVLDCVGYVYIEKDNKCSDDIPEIERKCEDIFIYDTNRHTTVLQKVDGYKILDNKIYAIGNLSLLTLNYEDEKKSSSFVGSLGGNEYFLDFENTEDAPHYIIIDTQNSDTTLYKDYSEMPEETKIIFQSLENK